MKLCLVTAATANDFRTSAELISDPNTRIPLGALCLASVLEDIGITPEIIDLDRLFLRWLQTHDHDRPEGAFSASVAARLANIEGSLFGFSSICSSYPLTLRIAAALKQLRPDSCIMLGGPQATAAAEETLAAFPSVDVVVRGEGEPVIPVLLHALAEREDLRSVSGISFRRHGNVVRNPDAPLLTDLDSLPVPAFDLLPYLDEHGVLPMDFGRGCPFSCTFCSTSQFFRHSFRTKSPPRIVHEVRSIKNRYDIDAFEFVHDNFTADRKQVVRLCEAFVSEGLGITWSCSARTDCLDDDLIDLMRGAGCRGIFLGIESGSDRIQKIIHKRLNVDEARERVRYLNRRKVEATVSLMAGFQEETMDDLGATVQFFVDALRYDYVDPQITLLSPLTGTPIHVEHRHELILDDIVSDMAFQGSEQDPHERDLIAAYPEVFSSHYSVPTRWLDRHYVYELRWFLVSTRFAFRWLVVAIDQATSGILPVFNAWQEWRLESSVETGNSTLAAYYSGSAFRRQFLTFVKEELAKQYPAVAHVLEALAEHLEGLESDGGGPEPPPDPSGPVNGLTDRRAFPVRAADVHVTRLSVDFSRVVRCLQRHGQLSRIPRQMTTLVTRKGKERTEIIQLSPDSAEILRLCDGSRDVQAVADAFAASGRSVEGVPRDKACLFGLQLLREQGLIRVLSSRTHASRAAIQEPNRPADDSDRTQLRRVKGGGQSARAS
jgi:radical SAM superfamily enzyme YgiQ (UPF0313 family)